MIVAIKFEFRIGVVNGSPASRVDCPITCPGLTPPPASISGDRLPQWLRPPLALMRGVAAHFTTADQQNLIAESACFDIVKECGDRVVEWRPHVTHAFFDAGVVLVGVHVPHKVCGDGDKACARFAQPPRHQHQFAECLAVVDVPFVIIPVATDI